MPKGGPDGGDGGKGGDVIIKANKKMDTLNYFIYHHHFFAENGENGMSSNRHGKNGKDVVIEVPVGTVIIDKNTGEIIADLNEDGKSIIVAKGGKGGKGNRSFATSTERSPHYSEKGKSGKERNLELRLKLLSDVGIIGFPNAGKSTLLAKVTNAKPTIGSYAFTTLSPKIGVVKLAPGKQFIIAEIPGIIQGASKGKGMGNEFLSHVDRTKVLLILIDGSNRKNIFTYYHTLLNELKEYNPELANKKRIIVINKIDQWKIKRIKELREKFEKLGEKVFFISAATGEGIKDLFEELYKLASSIKEIYAETVNPEKNITLTEENLRKFLKIEEIDEHTFKVEQEEIERHVELTDFKRMGSVAELMRYFKRINIDNKLKQAGAKEGDRIIIGNKSFIFHEDKKGH